MYSWRRSRPCRVPINTDADITDAELQAIQNQVQAEIENLGCQTDDELRQEVEKMNPVSEYDYPPSNSNLEESGDDQKTKPFFLASRNGEVLTLQVETSHNDQQQAQAWLAQLHANLIRDGQLGEPPLRWLSVSSRNSPYADDLVTEGFNLDHVLVDQNGVPTFVEYRWPSDTLGIGEVGARLAAYVAGGVSFWNVDVIRSAATLGRNADSIGQALENLLGVDSNTISPEVVEAFWERVGDNLQQRRIRLIFVADEIPGELRSLVKFLNKEMANIEVLVVEVKEDRLHVTARV